MDYPATLQYLYSQLPMFTRDGASALKNDLSNTVALCARLGNPQSTFPSVHIGGTNGKGSTSHMLAAILQSAGYHTGLYTSPHLKDFRERIRLDGQMIGRDAVIEFASRHLHDFDEIRPSFFEMTVAMAFDFFAREQVDIAVIEVGLGGRLDSTNIITPLLSVITNIGWDHMDLLGHTLPLIAAEKAGIIKPNVPVIIGEYQREVAPVFEAAADRFHSALAYASEEWQVARAGNADNGCRMLQVCRTATGSSQHLELDLTGSYQVKNVKTVLSAVERLREQGWQITPAAVQAGLRQVKELTGLRGRWELISQQPRVICDTGHNPEGIAEVLENLRDTPCRHLHIVIGMVSDKDRSRILRLLPGDATYYFCRPSIPRGLDAAVLCQEAAAFGLEGKAYPNVLAALRTAIGKAADDDLVFVGGSTFVVAEVI